MPDRVPKFRGDRLAALRIDSDMKQKEIAASLGVVQNTISAYETGISTPSINTALKLATLFNVSIDFLYDRTDNPKSHDNKLPDKILELPKDSPDELVMEMEKQLIAWSRYYGCTVVKHEKR